MYNYRLLIQYDGSRYNGWQRLGDSDNTIQGKMEEVLSRMEGKEVKINGASRTDGGVHARGQVANVQLKKAYDAEEIQGYVNRYLPQDIEILEVKQVAERFHARLNAGAKTYTYRIAVTKQKHVFERKYIYDLGESLDVEKMKEAASYLVGTHDFQSFCGRRMKKSTIRTLEEVSFCEKNGILTMTYVGSGFLYNMVRILTGTLIEVGLGEREATSIPAILEAKTRSEAGYLVPPKGLCLESIRY